MSAINLDTVAAAYVKTRDEIAAKNKEIDALKEVQSKREDWMLAELEKLGLQNVKTPHGVTVYKSLKESVSIGDWDAALNWVKDNDCYEFLTKGFNKTAVLEYMGDNRENPPPPGCNYTAVRTVGIRKG